MRPTINTVHSHDWWALLAIAVATVAIIYANGFSTPGGLQFLLVIPGAILLIATIVEDARGRDPRRIALMSFLAWMIFAGLLLAYSCYAVASTTMPLQDDALLALDHAIGIDPLAFRQAVGQSAWASSILTFAYRSTGMQLLIALIVVCLLDDNCRQMRKSVSLYTLGMTATLIGMALVPAVGAFPHLHMACFDPGYLNNLHTGNYIGHYVGLRDGTLREFPTTEWQGIVTFPSFHSIASLVAAYAMRPVRWLFWPSAVFSVLVLISTLPVGGHYAADVIGAVLIFAASVAWVEHRERRGMKSPLEAPITDAPNAPLATKS